MDSSTFPSAPTFLKRNYGVKIRYIESSSYELQQNYKLCFQDGNFAFRNTRKGELDRAKRGKKNSEILVHLDA